MKKNQRRPPARKEWKFCPVCGAGLLSLSEKSNYCGNCDKTVRENPTTIVRVLAHHPNGYVIVVRVPLINDDNMSETGENPFENSQWSLPGGRVEAGESPESAARRILFENLDVIAGKMTLLGIGSTDDSGDIIIAYRTMLAEHTQINSNLIAHLDVGWDHEITEELDEASNFAKRSYEKKVAKTGRAIREAFKHLD